LRYVPQTVALLAARSPKLRQALRDANKARHSYPVIDDPSLIPLRMKRLTVQGSLVRLKADRNKLV